MRTLFTILLLSLVTYVIHFPGAVAHTETANADELGHELFDCKSTTGEIRFKQCKYFLSSNAYFIGVFDSEDWVWNEVDPFDFEFYRMSWKYHRLTVKSLGPFPDTDYTCQKSDDPPQCE